MSISLTVITFKLHDDHVEDSPNLWEKRRDLCISVITSYSPIILCTQQVAGDDEGSQLLLLNAVEEFCYKKGSNALKEVALILKALYDVDLVEK
ncbi:hypothetical protein HN51_025949 [Arachis hypogaea]